MCYVGPLKLEDEHDSDGDDKYAYVFDLSRFARRYMTRGMCVRADASAFSGPTSMVPGNHWRSKMLICSAYNAQHSRDTQPPTVEAAANQPPTGHHIGDYGGRITSASISMVQPVISGEPGIQK